VDELEPVEIVGKIEIRVNWAGSHPTATWSRRGRADQVLKGLSPLRNDMLVGSGLLGLFLEPFAAAGRLAGHAAAGAFTQGALAAGSGASTAGIGLAAEAGANVVREFVAAPQSSSPQEEVMQRREVLHHRGTGFA